MALNIIERLTLIAEKLGIIADKMDGGGGGSLEPRVENLEHNVSSISTNLYNVANNAAYISSLAKRWEGSGEVGSYYFKDGSKGIYKCLVQTMSEPSYDSSDWELLVIGDELESINDNLGAFKCLEIRLSASNDIDAFAQWLDSQNFPANTKLFIHNNYGDEDVIIGTYIFESAWSFIRYSFNDNSIQKWRKSFGSPIVYSITQKTQLITSGTITVGDTLNAGAYTATIQISGSYDLIIPVIDTTLKSNAWYSPRVVNNSVIFASNQPNDFCGYKIYGIIL